MIHVNQKNALVGPGKKCPDAVVTEMSPPKTFGEDCLFYWENTLGAAMFVRKWPVKKRSRLTAVTTRWKYGTPGVWQWPLTMTVKPQDFKDLRRAMYHRHTDPSIESLESARDYFQQLQIEAAQEYLDKPTLYEQTRQKAYAPKD